jgi:hypothetical protein
MGSQPSDDRISRHPAENEPGQSRNFLRLLRSLRNLYEAARALDSPSRTSRIMFRKAGKAMAGLSVELASTKSATEALRSQLQDSKKGQRKRVTIDPNQTFANVDSIRNAQKAAGSEVAREGKNQV